MSNGNNPIASFLGQKEIGTNQVFIIIAGLCGGLISATAVFGIGIAYVKEKIQKNKDKKKALPAQKEEVSEGETGVQLTSGELPGEELQVNESEKENLKKSIGELRKEFDELYGEIQALEDDFNEQDKKLERNAEKFTKVKSDSEEIAKNIKQVAQGQSEIRSSLNKLDQNINRNLFSAEKMLISNKYIFKREDVNKQISSLFDQIYKIQNQMIRDVGNNSAERIKNQVKIGGLQSEIIDLETKKQKIFEEFKAINEKISKDQEAISKKYDQKQSKSLKKLIDKTSGVINKEENEELENSKKESLELQKEFNEIQEEIVQKNNQIINLQKSQEENQKSEGELKIEEIHQQINQEKQKIQRLNEEEENAMKELQDDYKNQRGIFAISENSPKEKEAKNNDEICGEIIDDIINEITTKQNNQLSRSNSLLTLGNPAEPVSADKNINSLR